MPQFWISEMSGFLGQGQLQYLRGKAKEPQQRLKPLPAG
jgi:hypothetical protein